MGLFNREPALVLGTLGTVLVAAYAKWQGVETEDVLAQVAVLAGTFAAIRAKVTPVAEKIVDRYRDLRGENNL